MGTQDATWSPACILYCTTHGLVGTVRPCICPFLHHSVQYSILMIPADLPLTLLHTALWYSIVLPATYSTYTVVHFRLLHLAPADRHSRRPDGTTCMSCPNFGPFDPSSLRDLHPTDHKTRSIDRVYTRHSLTCLETFIMLPTVTIVAGPLFLTTIVLICIRPRASITVPHWSVMPAVPAAAARPHCFQCTELSPPSRNCFPDMIVLIS